MQFNPMYHYVTYFRDIALNGVTPAWERMSSASAAASPPSPSGSPCSASSRKEFILYV